MNYIFFIPYLLFLFNWYILSYVSAIKSNKILNLYKIMVSLGLIFEGSLISLPFLKDSLYLNTVFKGSLSILFLFMSITVFFIHDYFSWKKGKIFYFTLYLPIVLLIFINAPQLEFINLLFVKDNILHFSPLNSFYIPIFSAILFPLIYFIQIIFFDIKKTKNIYYRKAYKKILKGISFSFLIALLGFVIMPFVLKETVWVQSIGASIIFPIIYYSFLAITKDKISTITTDNMIDHIFKYTADGIVLLDNKNHITQINTAGKKLLNIEFFRDESAEISNYIDKFPSNIGKDSFETKIKNGKELLISRAIYNQNSDDIMSILIMKDITEQNNFLKRIQEKERLFRTFIDQANDFIIIKDIAGRYLKINKRFSDIIGVKPKDIIGKTMSEMGYSQEFINRITIIEEEIKRTKQPVVKITKSEKSKKLKMSWLEEIHFPIFDEQGNIEYIGVVSRDISESKLAKIELEKKHSELKNAYSQLSKTHDMIVKQEKMASLGVIAAGMAHEINNPSQAIKFSMEGLKLNINDIKTIIDSIFDLCNENKSNPLLIPISTLLNKLDIKLALNELEMISKNNITSVERIEKIVNSTKRLSYSADNLSKCSINQIVSDAITLTANNIRTNLIIKEEFGDKISEFQCLYHELVQVMLNMILNSNDAIIAKFGQNTGKGVVTIRTFYIEADDCIHITISDNGKGIDPQKKNKIFDPFFTTKDIGKGTGLGLSICYKIISAHDGDIKFESWPDEGTIFYIKIPLIRSKNEKQDDTYFENFDPSKN